MNRASTIGVWVILTGIIMVLGAMVSQQIARNLTQTQLAVLEIQSTQNKLATYQMLVDTIPGGVCMIDEEGIITYANEGLEVLSLYNRRELVGHRFTKLMPRTFREEHIDRISDPVFRSSPEAAHQCLPNGRLLRSDGVILGLEIIIRRNRLNGGYEWMVFFDPTDVTMEENDAVAERQEHPEVRQGSRQ